MPLKLHKFVVQAALVAEDDDGNITGEQLTEPRAVFGCDGLRQFADAFEAELSRMNTDD